MSKKIKDNPTGYTFTIRGRYVRSGESCQRSEERGEALSAELSEGTNFGAALSPRDASETTKRYPARQYRAADHGRKRREK